MKFKLAVISSFVLFGSANTQAAIVANFSHAPVVTQFTPENGGTVVKINPADQNGVSINSYSAFDVEPQGVLLSNNTSEVRSTQGFNIEANDRLDGKSATVIINEVLSPQATQLTGPVEVVGNRADLILVNPSGITCNGCGFININNATLTTAQYNLEWNGGISYSVVSQAPIHITGRGLFDKNSKNINLITKSISLSAPIRISNTLNILTGNNKISRDLGVIQSFTNGLEPDIYVTSAGGMYANNINIVSTRKDENAFFNEGNIIAINNLSITANGHLHNATRAIHDAKISALYGQTTINLNQNGSLNNYGVIEAKNEVNITANRGSVNNHKFGSIIQKGHANGGINIVAESINNKSTNSKLESYGSITLQSNQFENQGKIAALHELTVRGKASNNLHNRPDSSTFNNTKQGQLEGNIVRLLNFDVLKHYGEISANDAVVLRGGDFTLAIGSTIFARNTFDITKSIYFPLRSKIQVGIRDITKTILLYPNPTYILKDWFFDANYARRHYDAKGNLTNDPNMPQFARRPLRDRFGLYNNK